MRRSRLVAGIALGAGLVGFYVLRRSLGLDLDPESMRAAVSRSGLWAPLVYVAIVTFRIPLALPSAVVLIGGGVLFGTLPGTLYGATGILLSAAFLFFAARVTGRDAIIARMPDRMRPFFELAQTRAGVLVLGLGTGYPTAPATMFHLLAGVTGMAFATFLLAAAFGALIRASLYTFFGSRLVEGDLMGVALATGIFSASLLLPLLFPRTRSWLLGALRREPLGRDAGDLVTRRPGAGPSERS